MIDNMHIAAFFQMPPMNVRDLVGQITDSGAQYEQVRDRIKASVTNRVAIESGRVGWSSRGFRGRAGTQNSKGEPVV